MKAHRTAFSILFRIIAFTAALLAAGGPAFSQGDLTPPGPPLPTMITLDQLEPRTPIHGGTNTVIIDTPGSYYLTGSIVTTGTAIRIDRDHVTVDLNGFTLTGTATSGVTDIGVWIAGTSDAPRANVTVRNGVIHGFVNSVWLDNAVACRLDRITTVASRGSSVFLDGRDGGRCSGNILTRCRMIDGVRGIRLYAANGECVGNVFADCIISGSSDQAIMFDPDNGQVSGNVFRKCSISDPFFSCVYIVPIGTGESHGNTFDGCTFRETANGQAIHVFTSGGTFNGNVIRDCAMSEMSGGVALSGGASGGACDNNRIEGCVIEPSASSALYFSASVNATVAGNLVKDNVIRGADQQGFWLLGATANRVEANHFTGPSGTGTTYGIRSSGTLDNVIVKNSSEGALNDFSISINDIYGPEVSTTGLLSDTGDDSHPWANYEF